MAIIKGLSSKATPQKIVDYLTQEEKTEAKLISGKDCNPDNIVNEFRATKELYDKTDGIQYHHMIQSFSPKDKITLDKAHELGMELAEKQFKGHEVFVVTHKDKKHLHNHLVVNSVSFEDGKKYHSDRKSMLELKMESNRQCEREGLTPLDLEHRATERVTTGEKRIEMKGGTPWKDELRQCIDFARERANNFGEFKESLKKNFEIDTRITNKTISYQHPDKEKPIRGSRLGTNYDKGELENEFIRKERSITGRGTEQQVKHAPRAEHEGENGVRKHTPKREFGDIEETIREVEQGVKRTSKRETTRDNTELQPSKSTSTGTENKQPIINGSHESSIEEPKQDHTRTIKPVKPKVHSRDWEFDR